MYDKSDPRASLVQAGATSALSRTGLIADPQEGHFYQTPPQTDDAGGKTWLLRGQNFLVAYAAAASGAEFHRKDQPDEYCVLLPKAGAVIGWNGKEVQAGGYSIAFVPPGDSHVRMPEGGELVRLFTTQNPDLVKACANAGAYDARRDHIPAFKPWPKPNGGWKVRRYTLDVPAQPGRFGRIFRCTTLMVNVLDPYIGPRDPSKMSPHHHDDFEQGSLALSGAFTHHLRWPWTTDMADWRDDRAIQMKSPSMLIIPPPVIHTTRATGEGQNLLVDIFSPPREDFSGKPGWVLNAGDYPMHGEATADA